MSITLSDIAFLQSQRGTQLLAELAQTDLHESQTLSLIQQLRKSYSADETRAGLTMARLRQKAMAKFGDDAQRMFFTEDALQQASDPQIRQYRSTQIQGQSILDVGCGIGSDSLAFAQAGFSVTGMDIDPVRIAIAKHNAQVLGLYINFEVADVRGGIPSGFDTLFYDPARRDENGRRIHHVEAYQPPLSLIKQWDVSQIMVKLSPGVDKSQLDGYAGQLEFISVDGALKEAVLHLGSDQPLPQATLIIDGDVSHYRRDVEPDVPITEPKTWLIEPDPAIIRAGLVQDLAMSLGGALLDETIAYFTTEDKPSTPACRAWRIVDWMPFNLKRLRAYLREHQVGHVTVKKRGFPMQPVAIINKLKLKSGNESRTLVFTRHQNTRIVLICMDIA